MTPTKLSLSHCRTIGGLAAVVERWNPYARIRQDLWGFIDILWIRDDSITAVQVTTRAHQADRIAKILSIPAAREWLNSPSRRIEVHGWAKVGPRGKRKRWEGTVKEIKREEFSE